MKDKPYEIVLTEKDIVQMTWACVQCGESQVFNWGAPQVIEKMYFHLRANPMHLIEVYTLAKKGA